MRGHADFVKLCSCATWAMLSANVTFYAGCVDSDHSVDLHSFIKVLLILDQFC